MKENCWEAKQCGREPGGSQAESLGVCPAAVDLRLDGANSGRAGGRACWVIAGTLCGGEVQGSFAKKFENCEKCDFHERVVREEFPNAEITSDLLSRIR